MIKNNQPKTNDMTSNIAKETILITGGCGFIGSNLVEFLLDKTNYDLRILDNLSTGNVNYLKEITSNYEKVELIFQEDDQDRGADTPDPLSPHPSKRSTNSTNNHHYKTVTVITGDISNQQDVDRAVAGVSAVVHLAAITGVPASLERPEETFRINVNGSQNVLEACRKGGVENFVLASSNAAVGDKEPPMHEEMVPEPISPYGASKLAGEALCRSYSNSFGINANALRFANVYGPYSDHKSSVVMKFVRRALEGKPLKINGKGNQTRDFIHARDIARGIYLALESESSGEVFHIGTGKEITINELTYLIQGLITDLGFPKPAVEYVDPRPGDIFRNYSDPSKAERKLSFTAKIEFDFGLEKLMETMVTEVDEPKPG